MKTNVPVVAVATRIASAVVRKAKSVHVIAVAAKSADVAVRKIVVAVTIVAMSVAAVNASRNFFGKSPGLFSFPQLRLLQVSQLLL